MAPLVVACLGDSNSLVGSAQRTWVDLILAAAPPAEFSIESYAVPGASVSRLEGLPNAWDQLERALRREPPGLVLLSFGTNDITWMLNHGNPREEDARGIVREYQALGSIAELAGAAVAVGLTPRPRSEPPGHEQRAALTRSLNEHLRGVFPSALLLDFEQASAGVDDLEDGLHLSAIGHERRARLVENWLSHLELDETRRPKLPGVPMRPCIRSGIDLVRYCSLGMQYFAWTRRLRHLALGVRRSRTRPSPTTPLP